MSEPGSQGPQSSWVLAEKMAENPAGLWPVGDVGGVHPDGSQTEQASRQGRRAMADATPHTHTSSSHTTTQGFSLLDWLGAKRGSSATAAENYQKNESDQSRTLITTLFFLPGKNKKSTPPIGRNVTRISFHHYIFSHNVLLPSKLQEGSVVSFYLSPEMEGACGEKLGSVSHVALWPLEVRSS